LKGPYTCFGEFYGSFGRKRGCGLSGINCDSKKERISFPSSTATVTIALRRKRQEAPIKRNTNCKESQKLESIKKERVPIKSICPGEGPGTLIISKERGGHILVRGRRLEFERRNANTNLI